jgi:hypothetical protein
LLLVFQIITSVFARLALDHSSLTSLSGVAGIIEYISMPGYTLCSFL